MLVYTSVVWGNCSSTLKDKLVTFQKRATRVILDSDCIHHHQNYLKQLNWQTFQVTYQKAILKYKVITTYALII